MNSNDTLPFFDFNEDLEGQHGEYLSISTDDPLATLGSNMNGSGELKKSFRRSMSSGDICYLVEALHRDDISRRNREYGKNGINTSNEGSESMNDSLLNDHQELMNTLETTTETLSQESFTSLAKPKHYVSNESIHKKSVSRADIQKAKNQLHIKPKLEFHGRTMTKKETTKAVTPNFKTTARHRPVDAMTWEQKQWQEFQEQQKFKIKAHPLNKKILQEPSKPPIIEKKPPTMPEPFKFTSHPQKVALPSKKINCIFRAQPVPKSILEPAQSKFPLLRSQTTKSIIPESKRSQPKSHPPPAPKKTRTVPLPFSFEVRNRILIKRKEELIRKVLEEEKKARIFHANPLPKAVLQPAKLELPKIKHQRSLENNETTGCEIHPFKARPATVLQKKPFIPSRAPRPIREEIKIKLYTDLRAEQREAFEKHLREQEAIAALQKHLKEMELKKKEEEEIRQLRKMAEHKAQPVRKYKEVIIQPSGKVTNPISPNFHSTRRERNHRENKENTEYY